MYLSKVGTYIYTYIRVQICCLFACFYRVTLVSRSVGHSLVWFLVSASILFEVGIMRSEKEKKEREGEGEGMGGERKRKRERERENIWTWEGNGKGCD